MFDVDISFTRIYRSNLYPGERPGVWLASKVNVDQNQCSLVMSSLDVHRCSYMQYILVICFVGSKKHRKVRRANKLIRRIIYVFLGL